MFHKNAKWIYFDEVSRSADGRYGTPALYFRKSFDISGKVRKATLYASSMGVFKAYINGTEVDNDYLSPGWTDYRRRIPYMKFDITDKLGQQNGIGIVVGDGWAVGYLGYEVKRQNYSDRPELLATVQIEYEDGSVQCIETDADWKVSHGEIVRSDILMGEVVDARLSLGDFSNAIYDDAKWENAIETRHFHARKSYFLDKAIAPKTTVMHILDGEFLYIDKNGRYVYDFNQNFAGVAKVTVKGKRGTVLTFRYAEMLQEDGTVYCENLRGAEATDTYILAGNEVEVFRPLLTFHGFRYMEIKVDGQVEILDTEGQVMYSELKKTAGFLCNDSVVNRLYQNIVWGQRGNFLNLPTDCPQRDERLGWTGDSQVFCKTAMFNMDCSDFYKKHLADIRDAQCGNGGVTAIAPTVPHADHSTIAGRVGAAGWADVITVLPYHHYCMYGDETVIKENIVAIKNHIAYSERNSKNLIRFAEDNYGDWLSIGEDTDIRLVATAFFAYSTRLAAELCDLINDADAAVYKLLYARIRAAFRKEFIIDGNSTLKSDTQTAYLLAFTFGLMDGAEIKNNLVRAINRNNNRLTTGFLGVKYLLPVLCEIGETELAYTLFTSRDYPSWCFSVVNGATTIWERWNSYTLENGFGDKTMNSFNHYAYGSVGEWMFEYCLGILPLATKDGAGFKKLTLRPFFDHSGKITSADGYYDSVMGRISVMWKKEGNSFIYKATVPDNINVTYDFGQMNVEKLADGSYKLTEKQQLNESPLHYQSATG